MAPFLLEVRKTFLVKIDDWMYNKLLKIERFISKRS